MTIFGLPMTEVDMKKLALVAMAFLTTLALTGCNTISGFGKDMQKAGEKIEGAAKK
jgi:predicted small secreted protein